MRMIINYYHLHPSLKRDKFCVKFYFLNVNGLSSYVSILTNETWAVYVLKLTTFLAAYHDVLFTCSQSFQVFR